MSSVALPYRVGLWFDFNPEGNWLKVLSHCHDPALKQRSINTEAEPLSPDTQAKLERMNTEGVWRGACAAFTQPSRHAAIDGPLTYQLLSVNADGSIVDQVTLVNEPLFRQALGEGWQLAAATATTFWYSGLLAVSFCHCKNVSVRRDEASQRLARRRTERCGGITLSYKTLEIAPMKKVLAKAGAQGPAGLKKALHICRGHFAHYEDKGLFGKYKGRFWIPQHVRGSIEIGAALKDYKVNAPAAGGGRAT
jgi:hypothetical protein